MKNQRRGEVREPSNTMKIFHQYEALDQWEESLYYPGPMREEQCGVLQVCVMTTWRLVRTIQSPGLLSLLLVTEWRNPRPGPGHWLRIESWREKSSGYILLTVWTCGVVTASLEQSNHTTRQSLDIYFGRSRWIKELNKKTQTRTSSSYLTIGSLRWSSEAFSLCIFWSWLVTWSSIRQSGPGQQGSQWWLDKTMMIKYQHK